MENAMFIHKSLDIKSHWQTAAEPSPCCPHVPCARLPPPHLLWGSLLHETRANLLILASRHTVGVCLLGNEWGNIHNFLPPCELYLLCSKRFVQGQRNRLFSSFLSASIWTSPLYKLVGNESKLFTIEAEIQILSLLLHVPLQIKCSLDFG